MAFGNLHAELVFKTFHHKTGWGRLGMMPGELEEHVGRAQGAVCAEMARGVGRAKVAWEGGKRNGASGVPAAKRRQCFEKAVFQKCCREVQQQKTGEVPMVVSSEERTVSMVCDHRNQGMG